MEEWRDIRDRYQVSNYGRIRNSTTGRILKPRGTKYLQVALYKDGVAKNYKVHYLVAKAFIPNPDNLPQVNHKDENKTNNFVWVNPDGSIDPDKSNLEWCEAEYNANYGTRNKRISETMTNGKLSKPVLQFSLSGEFIKEYPSVMEAYRQTGTYDSSISQCCNGKRQSAGGYIWQYK